MNRFVIVAFKAIAYAVIFVMIWSVLFYLYRAYSLNQKIESVMTSMEQEVSKHNYLTEDAYKMYEGILRGIAADMNNGDTFVQGFNINYSHDCSTTLPSNGLTYSKRLDTPADYGDVAVIELSVTINAVDLFYDNTADGAANELQIGDGQNGIATEFTYISQVPCLRYISVTN